MNSLHKSMSRFTKIISLCIYLIYFYGNNLSACAESLQNKGNHAIGDGNICVYGQNSDIVQFFGAPYSSPSAFRLVLTGADSVKSDRIPGAAIWKHQIIRQGAVISTQTDFLSSVASTFIREIKSSAEVTYDLNLNTQSSGRLAESGILIRPEKEINTAECNTSSYLIEVSSEVPLMFSYLPPKERYYRIRIRGNAKLNFADSTNSKLQLKIFPGASDFLVTAGRTIEELDNKSKILSSNSITSLYSNTQKQWNDFSAIHEKLMERFSEPGLKNAVYDGSVLIKSQQGTGGGVLAGHAYHMGYVRDQYGVSRGLLAMGHYGEAKKILEFKGYLIYS